MTSSGRRLARIGYVAGPVSLKKGPYSYIALACKEVSPNLIYWKLTCTQNLFAWNIMHAKFKLVHWIVVRECFAPLILGSWKEKLKPHAYSQSTGSKGLEFLNVHEELIQEFKIQMQVHQSIETNLGTLKIHIYPVRPNIEACNNKPDPNNIELWNGFISGIPLGQTQRACLHPIHDGYPFNVLMRCFYQGLKTLGTDRLNLQTLFDLSTYPIKPIVTEGEKNLIHSEDGVYEFRITVPDLSKSDWREM